MFQECKFEECDATVLLGGPYCDKHRPGKGFSKPSTTSAPSPSQRQPGGIRQPSKQPSPQQNRNYSNMAPQEKTGDAITVKTPLAVLTPASEKKQLPDRKVARKTTGAGSSKQAPTITATRSHDPRPSANRSSAGDAPSLDTRPPKRPRISTEGNAKDRGARHDAPIFTNNALYASPQIKSTNSEERDLEVTAVSGFSLHPRKAHSNSFGAPPAHRQRGEQKSIAKPSHQDLPRKAPYPANNVIDLTGDDPQSKPLPRQISHSNGQKGRDNISSGTHTRAEEKAPDLRQEGKSIEVQLSTNQINKYPWQSQSTVRNDPPHAGKATPNTAPRLAPKKPPPINIAPRPNPTLLPSNEGTPQLNLTKDKQKAPQQAPQHSPPYTGRPADPPRQIGKQIRHGSLTNVAGVVEGTEGTGVTNHVAANHRPASIAPSSISTPSTSSTNGGRTESRGAENAPQPQTSREQVKAYIQEILQRPRIVPTSTNGGLRDGKITDLDSSLPQPDSRGRASPVRQTQSKEINLPKPPSAPEQRQTDSQSSIQHRHTAQKPAQPFPHAFQHVGELNGIGKVANRPIGKSTLASMFPKRNLKHINVEERRQALIARHDPDKFDAFIYGKLNEPNRPGSALFDLPEYQQPPRPARPATHFAHIDPRVHWTHPRSQKWYQEKQDVIRERGTRKSNFGRATASAARRRQEEEKDNVRVDLPERVKRNPEWLAAIDELDEMADRYHARERGKVRLRALEKRGKDNGRDTIDDSDDEMEDISP